MTTSRISVGAAIDYLVAHIATAVASLTVGGQVVTVHDGWPDNVTNADVVVGLSQPPPEGDVAPIPLSRSRLTLGGGVWYGQEQYAVPCYIDARVGVIGQANPQKYARDQAEAVFTAIEAALEVDPSFGGLINGGQGLVSDVAATAASVGTVADPGRRWLISFTVNVSNVLNPVA